MTLLDHNPAEPGDSEDEPESLSRTYGHATSPCLTVRDPFP